MRWGNGKTLFKGVNHQGGVFVGVIFDDLVVVVTPGQEPCVHNYMINGPLWNIHDNQRIGKILYVICDDHLWLYNE